MTTEPRSADRQSIAVTDPRRAARLTAGLASIEQQTAHREPPVPRRRARRNSVMANPGAVAWRQLDRNGRARLWMAAQGMERASKGKGKRNGCLGAVGLLVLQALLFRFANLSDGRCDPSYTALQRATGYCRQSICEAIDRLEASGLLKVVRRMARVAEEVVGPDGRRRMAIVLRQISNAYQLADPARVEVPIVPPDRRGRAFPPRRQGVMSGLLGDLLARVEPSLSGSQQPKTSQPHPLRTRFATMPARA